MTEVKTAIVGETISASERISVSEKMSVGEKMSESATNSREADLEVVFIVDPFRLHRCLGILHPPSGASEAHVDPDLPIGADVEQSNRNFFDWLYRVYQEKDLPCSCTIKGAKTQCRINGCFHRMSPDAALRLVQTIQVKLADWGAACTRRNMTCGSVFVMANSGVGLLSLVQQFCGPFQD